MVIFMLTRSICFLQGTEYYDGKTKRYIDYDIIDILQMMGRAGRPQYDQHGKAVILVHEPKKELLQEGCIFCPLLRSDLMCIS
jgi:activating signal cointegrator complex subunit 3